MADIRQTDFDRPPTQEEIAAQIAWEGEAIQAGVRRYRQEIAGNAIGDSGAGVTLIRAALKELHDFLCEAQEAIQNEVLFPTDSARKDGLCVAFCALDAATLAYLTVRTVLGERPSDEVVAAHRVTSCARRLASTIKDELDYGEAYTALVEALGKRGKSLGRTKWWRLKQYLRTQVSDPWSDATKMQIGGWLIAALVDHCGGLFERLLVPKPGGKSGLYVRLTEAGSTLIEEYHERAQYARPLDWPMICAPRAWKLTERSYSGGYYRLNKAVQRTGINTHSADIPHPLSAETIGALNAVQATPWRINRGLLAVMQTAWAAGLQIGAMPPSATDPLPERLSDDVWERMTEEERKAHRTKLSEIHGHNARAQGRRWSWLTRLDMAEQMVDREAIWFPWFADFRGRLYPMVSDLSPQGDDGGKALLEFARGKALGEDGWPWLLFRAANCMGKDGDIDLDKQPLGERVAWTQRNFEAIQACAADPLGNLWWTQAEEPWSFLATCFEIAEALQGDPWAYVSHLPIPLDGSCNGLQHLSAMGRDPIGAAATNVLPSETRRDIYSEIASAVSRIIVEDAGRGHEQARQWLGHITRKVVKRSVMTTPYGVTDRGIRDQLINDHHTDVVAVGERGAAADYLRDCIVTALGETIVVGKQIMAWFQATARALADADQPFRWETPTGNVIQQAYYDFTERRVQTLVGRITLQAETKEAGLRKKKQTLAAAPNVIHSFDAAHLCRTVNACVAAGVSDFALIHDSYGTHAAETPLLAYTLRDEFRRIYKDNWLQRIEEYVRGYASCPIPSWTEYVTLGDLEVDRVIDAEFFFA